MISVGAVGVVDVGRYLQVGTCRVALHDREDQPCTVSRDEQLVRLVFGEDRQCSTARLETLHVLRVGLSYFCLCESRFNGMIFEKKKVCYYKRAREGELFAPITPEVSYRACTESSNQRPVSIYTYCAYLCTVRSELNDSISRT